jgi:hypothetical protein
VIPCGALLLAFFDTNEPAQDQSPPFASTQSLFLHVARFTIMSGLRDCNASSNALYRPWDWGRVGIRDMRHNRWMQHTCLASMEYGFITLPNVTFPGTIQKKVIPNTSGDVSNSGFQY